MRHIGSRAPMRHSSPMPGKLKIDPADNRPPVAPVLPEPDKQADHHRQVAARQTEVMEDYVELIADLIDSTGEAQSSILRSAWASPHLPLPYDQSPQRSRMD